MKLKKILTNIITCFKDEETYNKHNNIKIELCDKDLYNFDPIRIVKPYISIYNKNLFNEYEKYYSSYSYSYIYDKSECIKESNKNLIHFNKTIILDPNNYEAFYYLGIVDFNLFLLYTHEDPNYRENDNYINNENYINSMRYITKAIELNPNFNHAYFYRGLQYLMLYKLNYTKNKQYLYKAIDDFNKVLDLKNPKLNYGTYFNLGFIYHLLEIYDKSIDSYLEAIKLDPINYKNYQNIGMVYYYMGDYVNAYEYTKKAMYICDENDNRNKYKFHMFRLNSNLDKIKNKLSLNNKQLSFT